MVLCLFSGAIKCPTLILHGEGDQVCESSACLQFEEENTTEDGRVSVHIYPDTKHDLLDENPSVIDDIYSRMRDFLSELTAQW